MTAPESIERICRLVVDGRRAGRALADWARRFGLTEPEFLTLWRVSESPADGIDQTTLAQRLALSPAQISATVERLRTGDWIVQCDRPGDRRRHLWQLSARGRTRLQAIVGQAGILQTILPVDDGANPPTHIRGAA